VSQDTRGIIQGYFLGEPIGDATLKGKAQPQALHRLLSERSRVRTRFEAGLAQGVTKRVGRRHGDGSVGIEGRRLTLHQPVKRNSAMRKV